MKKQLTYEEKNKKLAKKLGVPMLCIVGLFLFTFLNDYKNMEFNSITLLLIVFAAVGGFKLTAFDGLKHINWCLILPIIFYMFMIGCGLMLAKMVMEESNGFNLLIILPILFTAGSVLGVIFSGVLFVRLRKEKH